MLCGCIMPLNINKLSENALTAIPESLGMPPDPSFGVVLWTLLIYLPTPQLAIAVATSHVILQVPGIKNGLSGHTAQVPGI